MRINEQHILVLSIDDWKAAGLKADCLRQAKARNQLRSSRACKGKPAEIEYESLPERFKEVVVAHFGNPYEYLKNSALKQYLNVDERALEYYATYQLEDGNYLPEHNQELYYKQAQWLNLALELDKGKPSKALAKTYTANCWSAYLTLAETEGVKLPTYSRFRKLLANYALEGYAVLISKKFGNKNTAKISDAGAEFLLKHYALPTKIKAERLWAMYNAEAILQGWKTLKDARSVYAFLNQPENKQQWYAGRHGIKKAASKYGYQLRTQLPTYRDALWYSDGTKLNFYYLDENNQMKADLTVYEIMDVYTEVMLGYAVGYSENFDLMYSAARMAMQTSAAKPYEWRYDNQGGHTKLKNEGFLNKLARISVNTQPYNAKSKTIESAFGRFQQYVMRELWFFTGQNITAKAEDSRANMEFILQNKSKLPSKQEAIAAYVACRNKWNNALHHAEPMPRMELYRSSVNPEHKPVGYLDQIELFWLTRKDTIRYRNSGLTFTHLGKTYEYEVLKDKMPDMDFRRNHIDRDFVVKYDPENLSHIRLYVNTEAGLRFVTVAEPRIVTHRAQQDHTPGERKLINDLLAVRKAEAKRLEASVPEIIINPDHTLSVANWQKKESYLSAEDAEDFTQYI